MAERYDVVIVGAGPAGSSAAYHLARAGRRVLMIEKARFPREKVCGDGLTPRAVRELQRMEIDTTGPEWARADGLRIIGGGVRLELPWPELSSFPDHALVMTRDNFDELLARQAQKAGADLWEETEVTRALTDPRGVVRGVSAKREDGEVTEVEAAVVLAGDGVASRLGLSMGSRRLEYRPMGVACRTYFRSPRSTDTYLESYLELWRGDDLLPGYGWIFPLPDGTVNVGLGLLNTSKHFKQVDYKKLLWDWVAALPPEWGFTRENQIGKIRGGSLPMGFSRAPVARPGLGLIGDAAGMVNPFNGEGIAYAMETGRMAAEIASDVVGSGDPRGMRAYPERLREEYEGYFILGRTFVKIIGNATMMGLLTRYGLPQQWLMTFAFRVLANLSDPRDGDGYDRVMNAMVRMAPTINTVARQ